LQLAALAFVLGTAAFYAGTHFVARTALPPTHAITHRQIAGIATDATWMDRASREQEEAPDQALALIGISPGMAVADVGAGSGYMTIRLGKLVGAGGHVYATDIQPAFLGIIRQKAEAERLSNIETVVGTETSANLPPDAVDLALLVDVYHELRHPQEMLVSIRRSLRTNGRLILVEYRKEDTTLPIADTHRISVAEARAEVEPEGFSFVEVISGLPRQHIIVFRKTGE
jgi:ubiquinone/menaquinone biosynthesis C-methylase UbiE